MTGAGTGVSASPQRRTEPSRARCVDAACATWAALIVLARTPSAGLDSGSLKDIVQSYKPRLRQMGAGASCRNRRTTPAMGLTNPGDRQFTGCSASRAWRTRALARSRPPRRGSPARGRRDLHGRVLARAQKRAPAGKADQQDPKPLEVHPVDAGYAFPQASHQQRWANAKAAAPPRQPALPPGLQALTAHFTPSHSLALPAHRTAHENTPDAGAKPVSLTHSSASQKDRLRTCLPTARYCFVASR